MTKDLQSKPNKLFKVSSSFQNHYIVANTWSEMLKKAKKAKLKIVTNIEVLSGDVLI